MATAASSIKLTGLTLRLVQDGVVEEGIAMQAQEAAQSKRTSVVDYLIKQHQVEPQAIALSAAHEFGLPAFDLGVLQKEWIPKSVVEEKLIRQHQALPIVQRGNRLHVAIADPTNLAALDEIKFNTGITTEPVIVEADKLAKLIDDVLSAPESKIDVDLDEGLEDLEFVDTEAEGQAEVDADATDDAPVVRFVNKVLLDAIGRGASDIHFEPYEKTCRVRLRIDGVLQEVASPPTALAPRIVARMKVMSRMDIAERRIPQDGRIKLQVSKSRAIDFRVNTLPTLFGEKMVLRILDPSSAKMGIDKLGYEPEQKKMYMDALQSPYGMILVTGPTGSGKTVSLYTGLNILNEPGRNISTAEDPAEINIPGINQVNVNPKVGLTFAAALRAFLRQDPDVIMVGEIRDLETAEIAIKAAQTGHLVLSTLHTNDAPQTLSRLLNMGVPAYNIASAVTLIIAQRLGRRLCSNCKEVDDIPRHALLEEGFSQDEVDAGITLYKPKGCDQCGGKGYKGRVGIYQVLRVSDEIGRIIMEGGNAGDIARQAEREGVADLRKSGLKKAKDGVTSLEEINRVTMD